MFKEFDWKQEPSPPRRGRKKRPEPFEFSDLLLGSVHGKPASDIEERYAKALDKLIDNNTISSYNFSMLVASPYQIPGQENQVDFFVWIANILYPVEVDGSFTHKTGEQKAKDQVRDAILNNILRSRYPGAQPIERVPGTYLQDQRIADEYARSQF